MELKERGVNKWLNVVVKRKRKKEADNMKTQNGFTLMNKNEIGTYLAKQKITRNRTRLQVQ